ncbi:hypothetical protein MCEMRE249_00027 [Candidatus Nanopelagicaceae bacterium]
MRPKPFKRHFSRPLLTSIGTLNILLIFAYWSPKDSFFPVHDFLDQFFVLYYLRGQAPHFFDFSAVFNGVLGQIPLNMLGINDLSLEANLYVLFQPEIAAVLNEFIYRNIALVGMYFLLKKLLPFDKNASVFALPSLLFASLPYYPYFGFTIATLPIIAILTLDLLAKPLTFLRCCILLIISLLGNFTYGGFAVLGILFTTTIYLFLRKNYRPCLRVLFAFLVLSIGYLQGISRLISLKMSADFISHRSSWQPSYPHWFDSDSFPNFLIEFMNLTLKGQEHFPSGQSVLSNHFIPGVAPILLFLVLLHSLLVRCRKGVKLPGDRSRDNLLRIVVVSIFLVNLFYAFEASGLTHFEYLPSDPFQFKRVTVLNPLLWSVLLALILSMLTIRFKRIVPITWMLIVAQIAMSQIGVQQKIFEIGGIERNRPSIKEHFEEELYAGLANKMDIRPEEINVLSFDLDPMIASYNGFNSFDGYLYNYPLHYKNEFRNIISSELELSPALREYFDGWGSRVYLFHRNVPVVQLKINWCAGKKLGADFVFAKEDLGELRNLEPYGKYKALRLYKIVDC